MVIERSIDWKRIDAMAGHRVDRRYLYAIAPDPYMIEDDPGEEKLLYKIFYTYNCSGCSCDCGDGYDCSHGAPGCSECGYTGRRRDWDWIPILNLSKLDPEG